jgi:ribosomal protein S21
MEQSKKPYKKVRKEEMQVIGRPNTVKVVHNQIEPAIKLWKNKLKDSDIIEQVKERKEYIKPSVLKRLKKEDAIRREERNRKFNK